MRRIRRISIRRYGLVSRGVSIEVSKAYKPSQTDVLKLC